MPGRMRKPSASMTAFPINARGVPVNGEEMVVESAVGHSASAVLCKDMGQPKKRDDVAVADVNLRRWRQPNPENGGGKSAYVKPASDDI